MNERQKFAVACQRSPQSMTELCAQFGISRKTGYKILRRLAEHGRDGLSDRSRAPLRHPNQTPVAVEAAILWIRKPYPTWGSKQILAVLHRVGDHADLPAHSTIDAVLTSCGCRATRRKKAFRRRQPSAAPLGEAHAPNDVWSIDYKGWFRAGDGTRCDPLTINDAFSRASLGCRAMVAPELEDVRHRLEAMFEQDGLPQAMLSDNGPPFGSTGIGRLSRLSVWLLRLGIRPLFIEPGRPDQNGKHERFHETLKAETASPPRATIAAQQAAVTRFQVIYNEERPHEGLAMRVPAELYDFLRRSMPRELPEYEYPTSSEVRRVRTDSSIKWAREYVFVGEAMRGELVGLAKTEDEHWHLHLGSVRLGVLHERS